MGKGPERGFLEFQETFFRELVGSVCPACELSIPSSPRDSSHHPTQDGPRPWHETEAQEIKEGSRGDARKRKTNREAGRGKKRQLKSPQKEAKSRGERAAEGGVSEGAYGGSPHTGGRSQSPWNLV